MITPLMFALYLLLAALILFPFICMVGGAWIGAYFSQKRKYEFEKAKILTDAMTKAKEKLYEKN